ncbi:MAG TPA: hypothetical protein VJG32_11555 [Anaerolineae bacterium]|nr:hypothetical protein [Anaerolineae bacterium]
MTALLIGVVVLAAIALVVLELFKTFGRDVLEALRNRWSWLLIGVNVGIAISVYVLARTVLGAGDSLGTAILVGVSFPVVLRSRFTFFRAVGPKDGDPLNTLSLKIDAAYSALQNLCWESVDGALADRRAAHAEQLADRISANVLIDSIEHHVEARRLEAGKTRDRERLSTIQLIQDERKRRYSLALLLIEISPAQASRLLRKRR